MEEKQRNRRCLSDVIPAEITDAPIIGMTGRREVTVDGFKGIEEYSEAEVTFRAGSELIAVCGTELVIKYMSLHTIVVGGRIGSVEFRERS